MNTIHTRSSTDTVRFYLAFGIGIADGSSATAIYMASPFGGAGQNWYLATDTIGRFNFVRVNGFTSYISSTGIFTNNSDDRIKSNKALITNAVDTLQKLKPKTYTRWATMASVNDSNSASCEESGLIAQEVFYDAPELRHIVAIPHGADSNNIYTPSNANDYSHWGSNTATLNYFGLVPYLIKAVQEQQEMIAELKGRLDAM
jgi:hypothetical protein